ETPRRKSVRLSSPTALRRYGSEKYPRPSRYRPKRMTLTSGTGRVSTFKILIDSPALLLGKRPETGASRTARARHPSSRRILLVCHGWSSQHTVCTLLHAALLAQVM